MSTHHLAKVLRKLGRAGLLHAARGAGGGYRFAANPKRIILCPATCDKLHNDYGAKIEIALGCETIIK